jgi:hypothetical protein
MCTPGTGLFKNLSGLFFQSLSKSDTYLEPGKDIMIRVTIAQSKAKWRQEKFNNAGPECEQAIARSGDLEVADMIDSSGTVQLDRRRRFAHPI